MQGRRRAFFTLDSVWNVNTLQNADRFVLWSVGTFPHSATLAHFHSARKAQWKHTFTELSQIERRVNKQLVSTKATQSNQIVNVRTPSPEICKQKLTSEMLKNVTELRKQANTGLKQIKTQAQTSDNWQISRSHKARLTKTKKLFDANYRAKKLGATRCWLNDGAWQLDAQAERRLWGGKVDWRTRGRAFKTAIAGNDDAKFVK